MSITLQNHFRSWMDSVDNQKGFALAVSSSAFIGASFIVKKKGLMRARASGHGAGACESGLFDCLIV